MTGTLHGRRGRKFENNLIILKDRLSEWRPPGAGTGRDMCCRSDRPSSYLLSPTEGSRGSAGALLFLWGWVTPPFSRSGNQGGPLGCATRKASYRLIRQLRPFTGSCEKLALCLHAHETKNRLERKTTKPITWRFQGRGLGWVKGALSLICKSAVLFFL